ncbi:tetraacyldisaccharide 4'-kinase [Emticicia sp. TH156]|uniref:tetraacyldisaccharide 4'-kinase n=1 Tax=Emticicia sp. TH156 TaxID=2067454 RepID=UPI000C75FB23|nr:tetraacyldisaccharide 4'-kinase [Emticicia sp. TH156]PLK43090.1 tetraacyldisaccharide 4'-kinase [Emticicia sp. TH156]
MQTTLLQILLFPFSVIMACIIGVRNWLYDKQILNSTRPDVFTINVGNLNLGGTGKTPHVEYLVQLLADKHKLSILSRGYKRATKGYVMADENATASTIGDEPMQYYLKFSHKIRVVVCEDRVTGVNQIQHQWPDNELVILDDAFQHRKIAAHLNLLLCDYNRPFFKDFMVPTGLLRDIRQSARRADAVIVTKCPDNIRQKTKKDIINGIAKYAGADKPVFFSGIRYKAVASYAGKSVFNAQVPITLVTAIAKPEVLVKHLKQHGFVIEQTFEYPDHFAFSGKEISKIIDHSRPRQVVTTEKDMVKIKPLLSGQELDRFFYVPIEVVISDADTFNELILAKVKGFISKSI